jgi:hypothetical protein
MKQHDGPLCPCCRREFVFDPFDRCDKGGSDEDDGYVDDVVLPTVRTPESTTVSLANEVISTHVAIGDDQVDGERDAELGDAMI